MSTWRLVFREIAHRKLNSLLALLSVVVAVATLTATWTLLRGHDLQTEQIITKLEAETAERVEQLKDDYRKIVLTLGFNVFVLPADVPPDAAHQAGIGGHEMPESYVNKLAESDIMTIDHLLPSLTAPILWPEQKRQVVLTGVRGEVAIAGKKRKRPLIQPVEPGQIVLGYEIAQQTELKVGEEANLLDKSFTVSRIHDARGTQDDNTVWIDLGQAQSMLGKEGKITAIQAINCLAPNCHPDATGIPSVSEEIARVLPEARVVIDMAKARARIDARGRAAAEAQAATEQEQRRRAEVRGQLDQFAAVLNPMMIVGSMLWIGLLALSNARERRSEVGILRAIGLGSPRIVAIFLCKALAIGIVGAAIGYGLGLIIGGGWTASPIGELFDARLLLVVMTIAPLLVALAYWLPALLAAQEDPAVVLCRE